MTDTSAPLPSYIDHAVLTDRALRMWNTSGSARIAIDRYTIVGYALNGVDMAIVVLGTVFRIVVAPALIPELVELLDECIVVTGQAPPQV